MCGPDIHCLFKMKAKFWCFGLTKQLDLQVPICLSIFSCQSSIFCPAR